MLSDHPYGTPGALRDIALVLLALAILGAFCVRGDALLAAVRIEAAREAFSACRDDDLDPPPAAWWERT